MAEEHKLVPNAPTGLTGVGTSTTQIQLTWNASPSATIYYVIRDGTRLGSVRTTTYTDSGLVSGTTYSYQVEAANRWGTSGPTMVFRCQPLSVPIPPPPPLSASYTWSKLKLGGGGLITGFASHYNYNTQTSDGTMVCRADVMGAYIFQRLVPSGGNAGGNGFWQQLLTTFRLPSSFLTTFASPNLVSGCYDIQIAPTNSSVIYMAAFTGMFVSTDQGNSFTINGSGIVGGLDSNTGNQRRHANKIGIDPNNPACAIVVTDNNAAYETTNGTAGGATTWSAISGIPNTGVYDSGTGIGIVAFDPSSGTTSGRTNKVYVASYGNNIYVRTSPSGSFSTISTSGSPPFLTAITDMFCASDGTLYTLDNGALVCKFSGGTWTNITPPFTGGNISLYFSVDKTNPLHVFVWASGGWAETFDGGSTWPQFYNGGAGPTLFQALDVPWLASTKLASGFSMDIASTPHIDPVNNQVMWIAGNQGVWNMKSNPATTSWGYTFTNSSTYALGPMTVTATHFNGGTYNVGDGVVIQNVVYAIITSITPGSPDTVVLNVVLVNGTVTPSSYIVTSMAVLNGKVAGIEELVGTTVCRPPSQGFTMLTGWDEGATRSFDPTVYPTAQSWDLTDQIAQCSQAEYASSDPTFMVCAMGAPLVGTGEHDAYSPSGSGAPGTFVAWSPQPNSAYVGNQTDGSIAASTPTNIVRIYNSNDAQLWVTHDNSTWANPTLTGVPGLGSTATGWGPGGFFTPRRIVAADRVTPNKFYAANGLSTAGMFETHDGGTTWNLIVPNTGATLFDPNVAQAMLKTVPGKAGHFFFTPGLSSGPHPQNNYLLYRCTDGLVSSSSLVPADQGNANYQVREVQAIGFGGIAPNQSYPSVCIWGYVNALSAGYVLGFWESVDNCQTWQQIGGPYPGPGWIDFVIDITGDVNTYGKWWAANATGSGFLYATK